LEHVERGDHVELPPDERGAEQIAGVNAVRESPRLLRGRLVDLDARALPAERLGAPQRPARAAADVEVATAASPRRAVPPEATRQHAPAPSRERAGTRVPHRGVAEARGEPPAGGPDARGRALERDARGRLLVARVVIGVAVS